MKQGYIVIDEKLKVYNKSHESKGLLTELEVGTKFIIDTSKDLYGFYSILLPFEQIGYISKSSKIKKIEGKNEQEIVNSILNEYYNETIAKQSNFIQEEELPVCPQCNTVIETEFGNCPNCGYVSIEIKNKSRKSYALLKILIFTILLVFLIFHKWGKNTLVDNPTNKTIHFKIDGKEYDLEPCQSKKINLNYGNHEISINNHNYGISVQDDYDYLLNPTVSNYIIKEQSYKKMNSQNETYLDVKNILSQDPVPFDTIQVKNLFVTGNLLKTNDILIEKTWNYSIDEIMPDTIGLDINYNIGVLKTKIYREDDFFNEIIKKASNIN